MHILAIVGSMRKNRNTHALVWRVISEIQALDPSLTTEVVYIADQTVQPCKVVCSKYCTEHPYQCAISDDVSGLLARMILADALLIGAPLYFRAPPAKFQAFIERLVSTFYFQESQGEGNIPSPLAGKPCGLVGIAEYSNPHVILEYLHDFCTVLKMRPVLLNTFPYLGVAGQGEVEQDQVFKPFERARELAAALVRAK